MLVLDKNVSLVIKKNFDSVKKQFIIHILKGNISEMVASFVM